MGLIVNGMMDLPGVLKLIDSDGYLILKSLNYIFFKRVNFSKITEK